MSKGGPDVDETLGVPARARPRMSPSRLSLRSVTCSAPERNERGRRRGSKARRHRPRRAVLAPSAWRAGGDRRAGVLPGRRSRGREELANLESGFVVHLGRRCALIQPSSAFRALIDRCGGSAAWTVRRWSCFRVAMLSSQTYAPPAGRSWGGGSTSGGRARNPPAPHRERPRRELRPRQPRPAGSHAPRRYPYRALPEPGRLERGLGCRRDDERLPRGRARRRARGLDSSWPPSRTLYGKVGNRTTTRPTTVAT
jgi:hypothetical protein